MLAAGSGTVLVETAGAAGIGLRNSASSPQARSHALLLTTDVASLCVFLKQGTVCGCLLVPGLHPGRGQGRVVQELSSGNGTDAQSSDDSLGDHSVSPATLTPSKHLDSCQTVWPVQPTDRGHPRSWKGTVTELRFCPSAHTHECLGAGQGWK